MSDLTRIYLRSNWSDELRRMFPRVSVSQIEAFGALAASDRLIGDDGGPTPALILWCEEVVGI